MSDNDFAKIFDGYVEKLILAQAVKTIDKLRLIPLPILRLDSF